MIPEEKLPAVTRALRHCFGTSDFQVIGDLTEGVTMTRVYLIAVGGKHYVLRLCTRTDGRNEPTRQFACMKIAAEGRIAPRVHYTDAEDRISIIDFIERRTLPVGEAAAAVAATLRKMHALPPFPSLTHDFDTAPTFLLRPSKLRDGVFSQFQNGRILAETEFRRLFQLFERVEALYPRPRFSLVSSHNDLKPLNILFDGASLWFIDWEAAYLNDPFNDLAVMANYVVRNEVEQALYLKTYFGEVPCEYRVARFYVMRQIVHMFYALAYAMSGSQGIPIDTNLAVPSFDDIHRRVWSGQENLESGKAKREFAQAHLRELFRNSQSEEFEASLQLVAAGGENRSLATERN